MNRQKQNNEPKRGQNRKTRHGSQSDKKSFNRRGTQSVEIYGTHAVEEALKNPDRTITALYATKNAARRIKPASDAARIDPVIVEAGKIDSMLTPETVHQGLYLETVALPQVELDDLSGNGPIILLDQVTDPQNVGAIMRTACAFGAKALVVTARNAPQPTSALAKAASGTLEHIPYIQVTNLARALTQLNDSGYQTIGLAGETGNFLDDVADNGTHARPIALVMGAEGKGIRELTAKTCTDLAELKLTGAITTLNVSAATAVALQIVCKE